MRIDIKEIENFVLVKLFENTNEKYREWYIPYEVVKDFRPVRDLPTITDRCIYQIDKNDVYIKRIDVYQIMGYRLPLYVYKKLGAHDFFDVSR